MSTQPLHVNGWSCHRLVNEGFTFQNGEWIKGKWTIILQDDYVSTIHQQWIISENHNDIAEAIEWFEEMEALETV